MNKSLMVSKLCYKGYSTLSNLTTTSIVLLSIVIESSIREVKYTQLTATE